ncbi:MAG: HIT family protein [Saprospiraceae bacterium]|nr:HIT family protein [Saprospiraceae bacterium]
MPSIFSRIVSGEIPCHRIAEDEHHLAFLDINPLARGHTLVIPKDETDYIFDIDDEGLSALMLFAKKVGLGIERAIPCKRMGITVIGLEVPHAHIHLIPINSINDMEFSRPKLTLSHEELANIADQIRSELKG